MDREDNDRFRNYSCPTQRQEDEEEEEKETINTCSKVIGLIDFLIVENKTQSPLLIVVRQFKTIEPMNILSTPFSASYL